MAIDINYSQILEDRSSFQVVRTNPKLTGNVKFTIDGNDNMWLNSIDANDELSKDLYKRVAIDPTISLSGNMFRFFNNGATPNDIVFDLKESFDNTKTSTDFKDQYDFSNYFSGAKYLVSNRYDERMSYFAPMYLKKDVPDFFIIFKINDPLNKNISDLKDEYPYNREEYIKELFKNASIIKTFDIRRTTKVGKYIRNYVESSVFPTSPLNVSYREGDLTEWNGIMFNSGVMGSRGELLSDFYSTSSPLKRFEEFITGGFERNGIIIPNLINFEFIFNDDSSDLYDFNRYLGVYVNAIELSKFDIDLERAYVERRTWENTPSIRTPYKEWDTDRVTQDNSNGVIIPATNTNLYLSDFENIFQDKSNMFFNYITDKDSNIYLPKLDSPYDIDYNGSSELFSAKIRLSNTNIELNKFYGPGEVFLQDEGFSSSVSGFSHSYINITKLSHLDEIKVYHLNGTKSDVNGRYDSIVGTSGYSLIPNPGDFYVYNDFDGVAGHDTFYFNIDGSAQQVVRALVGCLNGIRSSRFEALAFNEYAFIRMKVPSDSDLAYHIKFVSPSSVYSGIIINDVEGDDLISHLMPFQGGSRSNTNRLVLSADHYNKIVDNIDNILVKTVNGWSKIKKVSKYIDQILEKNSTTDLDRRDAISSFFDNIAIVLEKDEQVDIKFNNFMMRAKHRPSFGLLSFFPIKDFDFDFYSSEYLNFPIIDLYEHYFIPPNVELLEEDTTYKVVGEGLIEYPIGSGYYYSEGPTYGFPYVPPGGDLKYGIISGNPFLVYNNSGTPGSIDNFVSINDANEEYLNFEGFFAVKDPDKVVAATNDLNFNLRTKYINGLANSEYDFYKENSSTDFSLRSKILPYITKWCATDGTDSRNNPYRLNSELVFGFNNFSPDHEDTSQNPSNFTHEWFYIESDFNYTKDPETIKLNNSYFDEDFDLDRALTEDGYFTDYFTYTPSFGGEEIAETQTRYSPINKNNQGIYQALFKGFKISFKDYIDENNIDSSGKPEFNTNSNRFEDYKFTAILKPLKEDIDDPNVPPIRYRLIEQKTFKFVILLIEIRLGSIDNVNAVWESLSGTLDNSNFLSAIGTGGELGYDTINGDYRFSFNGNDISDLTYTSLYSIRNKKFNNELNNYSNIKLSSIINISNSGANNLPSIKSLDIDAISNYPSSLSDEIHQPNESNFVFGKDLSLGENKFIDYSPTFIPQNVSKLISATEKSIIFSIDQDLKLISDLNLVESGIPTGLSAEYYKNNYVSKILSGGKLYYETLFEKISFASFKRYVNSLNPFIEYESYEFDGSVANSSSIKWFAEIPDTSTITKKTAIVAVEDTNKPSNAAFNQLVGYVYQSTPLDNSYEINRYDGGFSPLFKNIFTFNSKFNFTNNSINALDLSNTLFNIDIDKFLKIQNFNHIKIANNKILSLEADNEFDPKYELIDEIAIGRADYDLLSSNWDYGFHYRYSDKKTKNPVSGTLRIEEDDTFISKLINLRSNIELENYNSIKVDDLTSVNVDDIEIAYTENELNIEGIINIENVITSFLLSDGIINKFNDFLSTGSEFIGNYETIEDYVKEYISINVLKLYEIENVEFFEKEDKSLVENSSNTNTNAIEFRFLTDKERFNLGYKPNKNLEINKSKRLILTFNFSKRLNSGLLISPKVKIKFI